MDQNIFEIMMCPFGIKGTQQWGKERKTTVSRAPPASPGNSEESPNEPTQSVSIYLSSCPSLSLAIRRPTGAEDGYCFVQPKADRQAEREGPEKNNGFDGRTFVELCPCRPKI